MSSPRWRVLRAIQNTVNIQSHVINRPTLRTFRERTFRLWERRDGRWSKLARQINPELKIFARAHSDAEVEYLKSFGANIIISGEAEIAQAMIEAIRQFVALSRST